MAAVVAELRLLIGRHEARLILTHGDTVVEDELWKWSGTLSNTEGQDLADTLFDASYDLMNHAVHGSDEG